MPLEERWLRILSITSVSSMTLMISISDPHLRQVRGLVSYTL
jgi:hypothetical protein